MRTRSIIVEIIATISIFSDTLGIYVNLVQPLVN